MIDKCSGKRVDGGGDVTGFYCEVDGKHYILEESAQVADTGPRGIEVAGFVEVTEESVIDAKDKRIADLEEELKQSKQREDDIHFALVGSLKHETWLEEVLEHLKKKGAQMECEKCRCTDDNCLQCFKVLGKPCHWVAPGKCSRCFDKEGKAKVSDG